MNKLVPVILGIPGVSLFIAALLAEGETIPHPQTFIVPTIVILVLILLNGIFVAAEFAVNRVRVTQVEELTKKGGSTAPAALELLESRGKQGRYIATAQLGITLSSLGLGMYGEPQIAYFLEPYLALIMGIEPNITLVHTVGYIVALSLLTYFHLVLGEIVPKTVAMNHSISALLILIRPMQIIEFIFYIPVKILDNAGNTMLRALKLSSSIEEEPLHSTQELEQLVTESAEEGNLTEEEEGMILNIFSFAERAVHQVMTPRRKIQAIPADIALEDLIELTSKSTFSRFPVYEGDLDHIIGILHLKDLIRQQLKSQGRFELRLLLRPAPTIPEHYPIEKLLNAFKLRRLHIAIVLDEYGGTAGIVTLEDLVEEIVGEVRDEFDKKEKDPLIELAPGSLEVSGQLLLDDLQDYVDLGDEEALPDVETVGGLIITEIGRPPQVGDQLIHKEHIKFTVLAIDGLAVSRVGIDFPVDNPAQEKDTTP